MQTLLTFSRYASVLLLLASFLGKAHDFGGFRRAVAGFRLLPAPLVAPAAGVLLAGELAAALLLVAGGELLVAGFALTAALLGAFTLALAAVLLRGLETPCGCFGGGTRAVAPSDLVRNAGFLGCALAGLGLARGWASVAAAPAEALLTAFAAAAFVLVWSHLGELIEALSGPAADEPSTPLEPSRSPRR